MMTVTPCSLRLPARNSAPPSFPHPGGFLRAGNVTLLIGVEDERVSELIDLIGRFSRKRTQLVQPASTYINEPLMSAPVEITVGGATVFVLDVAQFYKL